MRRPSRSAPAASPSLVFGVHPVTELLRAAPTSIERVWVADGSEAARIRDEAARVGVTVETTDRATLDRMTGGGRHQNVAARARPFSYADLDDVLARGTRRLRRQSGSTRCRRSSPAGRARRSGLGRGRPRSGDQPPSLTLFQAVAMKGGSHVSRFPLPQDKPHAACASRFAERLTGDRRTAHTRAQGWLEWVWRQS